MADLTRAKARTIVETALSTARERGFKPLVVAVYDARGALKAYEAEDGTSLKRGEIAMGKAYAAIALGVPSRTINAMALERPHFRRRAVERGGRLVRAGPRRRAWCATPPARWWARSASRATRPTTTRAAAVAGIRGRRPRGPRPGPEPESVLDDELALHRRLLAGRRAAVCVDAFLCGGER